MFKACCLLLLTLVLHVQLCSSAPIPAKAVQSCGPGSNELATKPEDHSDFIEEKEPVQEKLIPVGAGEASPEESLAEEDIPVIAKEPEQTFIEVQVSHDADEFDESQESDPQDPLAAAPGESTDETERASLDETIGDVALAVAAEIEQQYGEDPAPEAPASEAEVPEENEEEETSVAVENAPLEQHDMEVLALAAPIPIIADEDEASDVNAAEEAAPDEPALKVPDDSAEVEPAAVLMTTEKEKYVFLVPAELETEEAGQVGPAEDKPAAEESAPEEPAVIVPVEPDEQRQDPEEQEEIVSIISSETKEQETLEEHAKEEEAAVAPVVLEVNAEVDPATNKDPLPSILGEEDAVALVVKEENADVDPATKEEPLPNILGEEEAVALVVLEENADVDPATKEEPLPNTLGEEEAVALVVLEVNAEVDPATNKEPLPSILGEEDAVALVVKEENADVDPATKEEPLPNTLGEEEAVALVVLEENADVDPATKEEPLPNTLGEEEAVALVVLEENADVDPATKEEPLPNTLGEEEAVALVVLEENADVDPATNKEPLHNTLGEEDAVALVVKEENADMDTATNEEPLPSTLEEEDAVVPVFLEGKADVSLATNKEPLPNTLGEEEAVALVVKEENADVDPATKEEPLPNMLEEEAVALVVLEENADVDLATNEEPLPSMLEEEEAVALFHVEFETKEEGQVEPAAEDTAPEDSTLDEPAVIIPMEPAEQKPDQEEQEETLPIISSETKEEAPEEHTKEEKASVAPVVLEEKAEVDPATNKEPFPSTSEEDESVSLFPVELETKKEGQVDPDAEETAPEKSAPEDPVIIVPLDLAEQESKLQVHVIEESIPIVSPEAPEEEKEAPVEYTDVEAAGLPVPIVPEENAEEDPATNEEPPHCAPEEEKSVVLGTGEEQTAEETATALEKPAVIIFVEPTSEEPAPEDPTLITPLEDLEEDALEDRVIEEVVQSDPPPTETALAGITCDSDAEIPVKSVTETPSQIDTIETALDPGEEVPVVATEVHSATEISTEAAIEPVRATHAPAVSEEKNVPAPLEGGDGNSIKTHRKDFKAAAILIEDEPVVLLNRGTVLGAAFFTVMSFIVIGFVGTAVSKKLR